MWSNVRRYIPCPSLALSLLNSTLSEAELASILLPGEGRWYKPGGCPLNVVPAVCLAMPRRQKLTFQGIETKMATVRN